jgi:hypothetical protein
MPLSAQFGACYQQVARYLLSVSGNRRPDSLLRFKTPNQLGPFPQIPVPWKGSSMFTLASLVYRPKASSRLFSDSVTTLPLDEPVLQLELSFIEEAKAAPLGWILDPEKPVRIVDHVIAYLLLQEAHESNLHIKADLRQAQICLILASRGNTDPFVSSSYVMYGTHPDKVYPKMRANRMARLGEEYSQWFDAAGNLRPDVPKKPQVSSPTQDAAERSTSERLAALIQIPKKELA